MNTDLQKLLLATTALRDIEMGYSHREIGATQGGGLPALLRELVTYLDERGALSASEREIFGEALPDVAWKPPAPPAQFEPFRLVLESFAAEGRPSPVFAEIEVTPAFVNKMQERREVLRRERLSTVTEPWGAPWAESYEAIRMGATQLVLDADGELFLEASPRNADYACQTHAVSLEALACAIARRGNGQGEVFETSPRSAFLWHEGVLFHGSDEGPEAMVDVWLEYQAEAAEAASARPRG